MKKLKDLLKESNVWDRQFGQKLPTLSDVTKAYNEKKVNEGPSYEYGRDNTNIEKSKVQLDKAINGLAKTLKKKGHNQEAKVLVKKWDSINQDLDDLLDDTLSDLL